MPRTVDPTSDRALYRQIADLLREDIQSGRLAEGAQVPSERALMDAYGAARGTIRQALAQLRSEGLISTEHGRGGFVRRRPPIKRLASDRFARQNRERGKAAYLAEMEVEGRAPGVEVLEVGPALASRDTSERLDIAEGDQVLVRRRRYLADGQPTELATSFIPWDLAVDTPMVEANPGPGGIYARLEERGHELARFTEEVSARMPSPDEARSLALAQGVPVIALVRTAYDIEGRAVEVCDTLMAANRYVLAYELPAH